MVVKDGEARFQYVAEMLYGLVYDKQFVVV
jgi:hypothetical protein